MALTLWLTDRSRYEDGTGHCARSRYLRYHAGPHGYGWDRKAQSMPTVTGGLVHDPLTRILAEIKRVDMIPSDQWIYQEGILPAVRKYEAIVAQRGLAAITDQEELDKRVMEQTTLLESLVWVYVKTHLPHFHQDWKVILVEEEFVSVVGCTCGLGDLVGTAEDHDSRECAGIGWQTRGDCIAQHRTQGTYRYNEFKTTSSTSQGWENAWPHRVQLMAGILGAEYHLGHEIDEVVLPVLIKGRNQREWDPMEGKASGPKYQASPLVYGGRRPANLPNYDEQWLPKWANQYYRDGDGKNRKIPKEYQRTGIWELPASLWEAAGCLSPSHYWVQAMPQEVMAEQFKIVGPFYRVQWRLDAFLAQLQGEELRWATTLTKLYECVIDTGKTWGDPEFMALLDQLVPQNRGDACESFFGDVCPFLKVCDRLPGWETPEGMEYVPRRPHHQPELDQAIERGLIAPEIGAVDEVEE